MTPAWLPLLVLAVPFAAALATALLPWRRARLAHALATLLMLADTALAGWQLADALERGTALPGPHANFLDLGALTLDVGLMVDPAGAILAAIVCGLGTVVLGFNAWYMHGDPRAARFPWQFCFFLGAMLGVALSDNLFLTFCCWELVGLGSYLLIGFWADRPAASDDPEYQANKGKSARGVLESVLSPAHAQLKAFVVNRVGDAGFLIGIGALLALTHGSGRGGDALSFAALAQMPMPPANVSFLGLSGTALLTLAALGIFCGAVGKSAQFPLHVWLPDAMQGPTTASSIIHAATMVAAGVFLVARCAPIFPPEALAVVGWTGGITCLLCASIACVQWDLKAVLAYSTCSQLGLMFTGLGASAAHGGDAAALAHLFTHALFKCLLFLCAGAVIHACHGHQDLHRLGGLRQRMPVTAYTSLLAVLAITGAPFCSGFYSKDAVLAAALAHAQTHGGAAWGPLLLAAAGSALTAAYMLRWWLRVFAGAPRDAHAVEHAHDPRGIAKFGLVVLAPFCLALPWTAGDWLDRALASGAAAAAPGEGHDGAHMAATTLALALFAAGGAFALFVYGRPRRADATAERVARALRPLHTAAGELWGIDRLWHRLFTRGVGTHLARLAARLDLGTAARQAGVEGGAAPTIADALSLDGLIDGLGRSSARLGRVGALAHAGRVSAYLAFASVLAAAFALWSLLR